MEVLCFRNTSGVKLSCRDADYEMIVLSVLTVWWLKVTVMVDASEGITFSILYLINKQQDFREFTCKNVVLLVKPIAFLAFSLPSSSSITRRARKFHVVIVQ